MRGILSLSIGECTSVIMIGWILLIVAALCFLSVRFVPLKPAIPATVATGKSKVFAPIGLGFCLLGLASIIVESIFFPVDHHVNRPERSSWTLPEQ